MLVIQDPLRQGRLQKRPQSDKHWGAKSPPFFMDKNQILLESSEFLKKETRKIIKEVRKAKTKKQKEKAYKKLSEIRQRILFNLREFDKAIENEEGEDFL